MNNILSNLSLSDERDTQLHLAQYLRQQRKRARLSREKLAEKSGIPAPTIKRFELSGEISLRQFLRLWLVLDDLSRLDALTKPQRVAPQTIEDVLNESLE
ncbi:helix-turn-helix domain-containing protein [Neisseriaceae bacterium B1]